MIPQKTSKTAQKKTKYKNKTLSIIQVELLVVEGIVCKESFKCKVEIDFHKFPKVENNFCHHQNPKSIYKADGSAYPQKVSQQLNIFRKLTITYTISL